MGLIIKMLFFINLIILSFVVLIYLRKYVALKKLMNENKKKLQKDMDKTKKHWIFILSIIFITIAVILLVTSILWIPILVWLGNSFKMGYVTFTIILIIFSSVYVFILPKFSKTNNIITEGSVIRVFVFIMFIFYTMLFVLFGWNLNLLEIMKTSYEYVNNFKNTLTILSPIIIIGVIVTNIFVIINGALVLGRKRRTGEAWLKKLTDIIMVFVFSGFVGILYITETNLGFVDPDHYQSFLNTLSVFKIILGVVAIPIVLKKISPHNIKV